MQVFNIFRQDRDDQMCRKISAVETKTCLFVGGSDVSESRASDEGGDKVEGEDDGIVLHLFAWHSPIDSLPLHTTQHNIYTIITCSLSMKRVKDKCSADFFSKQSPNFFNKPFLAKFFLPSEIF